MRYLSNIEKSAFRRGEYVGYADGAWRVEKEASGWRASKLVPMSRSIDFDVPSISAPTLEHLSARLTEYSNKAYRVFVD